MRAAMSPVRSSAYKKRHGAIKSQIHPEPQAPLQIPPHSDDIPGKNNSPPGEYQQPPLTGEPARIDGLKAKKRRPPYGIRYKDKKKFETSRPRPSGFPAPPASSVSHKITYFPAESYSPARTALPVRTDTKTRKPRQSSDYQGFSKSRGDKIRTCDHAPPRRVL